MKQFTRISSVAIINNATKFLLCRLSPIVTDGVGKWTLPGGGIDFGESPKSALIREIKEETGLTVERISDAPLDIHSELIKFVDKDKVPHSVHALRIIYFAFVKPGELIVERNGSTDACAWFSDKEIEDLPLTPLAIYGLQRVLKTATIL